MNEIALGKTEAEAILFRTSDAWLEQRQEAILEPDLPIIDPHHHLWDRGSRYLFEDILRDVGSGHNIRATVHLQCDSMYPAEGDRKLAPIGETQFINGVAAMSASGLYGPTRICAGIVGFANLLLGERVDEVLEAHLRTASRFRGVRYCSVWDADPTIKTTPMEFPKGLLLEERFRAGFARLSRFGLSFDSWLYHPQIPELADLAHCFPQTPIILDHVGAPLAIGVYADRREEVFKAWRRDIGELAKRPNACVKLGGMGMHVFGFGFDEGAVPPSSEQLAQAWRPYIETCIEAFGVDRCMFESNFPVDKRSCSYAILWNAFKRVSSQYTADERAALFQNTAARVYRLSLN